MLGCDLPEEVLMEIFSWVPPEALIRSKCVSKSWYALINFLIRNPEFVNKHLRNMDTTSTCLVFCCVPFAYCHYPESESLRQTLFKSININHNDDDDDGHKTYVCENFSLPTLPIELNLIDSFKRHCNGIICFAYWETIILCNPAIKQWRSLPNPCLAHRGFRVVQVEFGYDLRANDFKVVRLGHDTLLPDRSEYFKIRAEVYSMRSDSWREIGIQLEFDSSPFMVNRVFCKGFFYWFLRTHKVVFAFDMFDEVFHSIPLPNNLLVAVKDHFVRLTVWNESIALFVCKEKEGVTTSFEIWVTDDCFSCSWIRKLIVRPPVKIAYPLAFLKNDELLMLATTTRFVLYNVRSRKVRYLIIKFPDSSSDWDFSYVKSFLSVQGGSQSRS